jgi:hypothetical protein
MHIGLHAQRRLDEKTRLIYTANQTPPYAASTGRCEMELNEKCGKSEKTINK